MSLCSERSTKKAVQEFHLSLRFLYFSVNEDPGCEGCPAWPPVGLGWTRPLPATPNSREASRLQVMNIWNSVACLSFHGGRKFFFAFLSEIEGMKIFSFKSSHKYRCNRNCFQGCGFRYRNWVFFFRLSVDAKGILSLTYM